MSTWFASWLVASTLARAQGYYLESDPVATREAADALSDAATGARCPGAVVRRYVQGEGWRFVFRSTTVGDVDLARGCVAALELPVGVVVRLVEQDADRRRVIGVWPSDGAVVEPPSPPQDPRLARIPTDASEIVSRMERAHAGASGGAANAPTVLFRFDRITPGGGRIRHVFVRRGDDRYLSIDVLAGDGRDSKSGIVGQLAWLEGSTKKLDAALVRAQIDRFSPESVLQIAADLGAGKLNLPDAGDLHVDAVRMVSGRPLVELASEGDADAAPTRLIVDGDTWRLLGVEHGAVGASMRWTFEGWRELEDGALRPDRVIVSRGSETLDTLELRDLELSPTLPPEWFAPPLP